KGVEAGDQQAGVAVGAQGGVDVEQFAHRGTQRQPGDELAGEQQIGINRAGCVGASVGGLDVSGVVSVAFIWQHVGGSQNPMFLTVFALPVVGAIFSSRWHPYLIATIAVIAVGVVALSQAPELRWYASGLMGTDKWLTWLFGNQSAVPQPSFSGFFAPSNYSIVSLEVFTISLFACAVAAEYVGTIFERSNAHIVMARNEAERGQ
ncbi:hypothetical protein OY671_009513, partial [Metschnikowia pulcherrima]